MHETCTLGALLWFQKQGTSHYRAAPFGLEEALLRCLLHDARMFLSAGTAQVQDQSFPDVKCVVEAPWSQCHLLFAQVA